MLEHKLKHSSMMSFQSFPRVFGVNTRVLGYNTRALTSGESILKHWTTILEYWPSGSQYSSVGFVTLEHWPPLVSDSMIYVWYFDHISQNTSPIDVKQISYETRLKIHFETWWSKLNALFLTCASCICHNFLYTTVFGLILVLCESRLAGLSIDILFEKFGVELRELWKLQVAARALAS